MSLRKHVFTWHNTSFFVMFGFGIIFVIICIWQEINVKKMLREVINCLFLITIIAIFIAKIWKIIKCIIDDGKFYSILLEGILILVYIFIAFKVHAYLEPEKMYELKVRKLPIMIKKANENGHKTIQAFRAKLVLGEDMNHSAVQIESSLVYATIMLRGIKVEEVYCETNWGDSDQWEKLYLRNGGNYVSHKYSSPGRKEVRCKIMANGDTKELISNIEIIGGK